MSISKRKKGRETEQSSLEDLRDGLPTTATPATRAEEVALCTAVRAGSLMVAAGAEAYRCEETMRSILDVTEKENDSYVMGTGLVATLITETNFPLTITKRVKNRGINLAIIDGVNQISRDLSSHLIDFKEANLRMDKITSLSTHKYLQLLCTILMTGAFSLLLSGNFLDAFGGVLDGFILVLIKHFTEKYQFRAFASNAIIAFFLSIGAVLICNYILPQANQDMIIAGALMFLFPGTSFTAAVRDTLQGDFVSGLTRALEAILISLALSMGVGIGLSTLGGLL